MKVLKRNAVILTVLLFVCVAVYLNWSYNRGQDLSVGTEVAESDSTASPSDDAEATDDAGTDTESGSLTYEKDTGSAGDYFSSARLSRQQARDSATETLQQAAAVDTASQEERDNALAAITVMADYVVTEAQIENILMAKDFADCVVFISANSVNVTVPAPAEGLSAISVAKITETVMASIDVTADQIKIIEVN